MSQSTTAGSTESPPELDNSRPPQSPDTHALSPVGDLVHPLPIHVSPVIQSLAPEARPSPSPACETCPMAMWYATKEELRCFCARTHGVVWTLEDPPIMKCDGRELALLQMQAVNA